FIKLENASSCERKTSPLSSSRNEERCSRSMTGPFTSERCRRAAPAAARRARRLPERWLSRCSGPGSCFLSGLEAGIGFPAEFGAVDLVKEREDLFGSGVADAIEHRLRLLSSGDEALLAQFGKVLGQRGLAEPDTVDQFAHRQLACLREVAENK